MAQFSLSLLSSNGELILTDYTTSKNSGLTFDEKFNLSTDTGTLSFSMFKYQYHGLSKEINPAATYITYGSLIKLIINESLMYNFNINSIKYTFLKDNIQIDYSAQDSFQYELSKIGLDYSISDDTTSIGYIGAQTIDAGARKILKDNNVSGGYGSIENSNAYILNRLPRYNSANEDETGNRTVSFACSNSNAFAALKQLASDNEYYIEVNYATHSFSFKPRKNPYFKGYTFNPLYNAQDVGLSGSSDSLATILDITGPTDQNNAEITIVPNLTPIAGYINSTNGDTSVYHENMYADLGYTTDSTFNELTNVAPGLENKLIDISYYEDSNLISANDGKNIRETLYNTLRITNGKLMLATTTYLSTYEQNYTDLTDMQSAVDAINAQLMGYIDDYISNDEYPAKKPDISHWTADYTNFTSHIDQIRTKIDITGIVDKDDFMNKYVGNYNTTWNILVDNINKFELEACKTYTTIGKDNSGNDIAMPHDYKTISFYIQHHADTEPAALVQECARIAQSLTVYWKAAYNAACVLGVFLPSNGDYFSLPVNSTSGYNPYPNQYVATRYAPVLAKQDGSTGLLQDFNTLYLPKYYDAHTKQGYSFTEKPLSDADYFTGRICLDDKIDLQSSLYYRYDTLPSDGDRKYGNDGINTYYVPNRPLYYTAETDKNGILNRYYCMPVKGYKDDSCYGFLPDHYTQDFENGFKNYGYILEILTDPQKTDKSASDMPTVNYFIHTLDILKIQSQTNYYQYRKQHNAIGQQLYNKYPQIFREAIYSNTSASTSLELLKAAKQQLELVAHPEYTYSLTGLDLGSIRRDNTYDIILGDQVHLDYKPDEGRNDNLTKAIKEPLYISSINRTLRSDGDIQYGLDITHATDVMLSRFAKILNFDR